MKDVVKFLHASNKMSVDYFFGLRPLGINTFEFAILNLVKTESNRYG